ncbi:hypothetical protein GCM10027562_33610 [Arthrobacter pigmenti]
MEHGLIYFIDSMFQVESLDAPRRLLPGMRDSLSSTNVFVHVEATRAGAGVGLLESFMADQHIDLVQSLPAKQPSASATGWLPDPIRSGSRPSPPSSAPYDRE